MGIETFSLHLEGVGHQPLYDMNTGSNLFWITGSLESSTCLKHGTLRHLVLCPMRTH